jgi:nucleoside-diphosphate-sugar epimerase
MIGGHRIFITGGGGFIGSHLCERLVEENEIVVFDNGHRNAIQQSSVAQHPRLKLVQGDVLQPDEVAAAMDGCDIIVHAAAIAGIDSVVTKRLRTMQVNLLGTVNVLEAALREGNSKIRRAVVFSTSEVYGPYVYRGSETDMTTQGAVGDPRWSYAVSKIAAEHLAFSYFDAYGLPITTVRPFNVYGPRQIGESAMHKFCINALRNEDLKVTGDGNQIRAWCYVDDFVDGLLAVLQSEKSVGQVFNLGNPRQTATIFALAEIVTRVSGSKSRILFTTSPMTDVEVRVPSIQKAKDMLSFEPKVGLEEGIQRSLKWYRENEA